MRRLTSDSMSYRNHYMCSSKPLVYNKGSRALKLDRCHVIFFYLESRKDLTECLFRNLLNSKAINSPNVNDIFRPGCISSF